jgi:hypothetical protein
MRLFASFSHGHFSPSASFIKISARLTTMKPDGYWKNQQPYNFRAQGSTR